jgi:hypothetical protein
VSRGASLLPALLITLATPATWPLALGAFLLRGGIVLVLIPIVVLPTPVGIGNLLAPAIVPISLGAFPLPVIAAAVGGGVALAVALVGGGWLAALLEAEGARLVAADDDLVATAPPRATSGIGRAANRILVARLVTATPLVLALAWAGVRVVSVTYDELTLPSDPSSSLATRVASGVPDVLLALAIAWMLAEILGAIAARRIALADDPLGAAIRVAVVRTARGPVVALVRLWLPMLGLVVVLVASGVATASAWSAVGAALDGSTGPVVAFLAVVLFVALWLAGLFLIAVTCAWRAAVWTVAEVVDAGTFGGSTDRRPGDWRADRGSARL